MSRPQRLILRRQDLVTALDPRLDAQVWHADQMGRGVLLRGAGERLEGEISAGQHAWPWLEARYQRGTLVVCGFRLASHWNDGPTPRFLLARMFEHLTQDAEGLNR
jgi:hypothetical protein